MEGKHSTVRARSWAFCPVDPLRTPLARSPYKRGWGDGRAPSKSLATRYPNQQISRKRTRQMKLKTVTPIFALPLAGVVALTLALSTGAASVSASSERNRALHVTKECNEY